MLVVVQHRLTDPPTAFARGERLKHGEGAPPGTRVLQFLPSQDGTLVTCLWESGSVEDVQSFVDDDPRGRERQPLLPGRADGRVRGGAGGRCGPPVRRRRLTGAKRANERAGLRRPFRSPLL